MDKYVVELIERLFNKSDWGSVSSSFDRISWKAARETETLNNKNLIPQFLQYIDQESDEDKREMAYFVLKHLYLNTNNHEGVKYLISRVSKESSESVISSLLTQISYFNKTSEIDLYAIIVMLDSNSWMIRSSAISALKFAQFSNVEQALLDRLEKVNKEVSDVDEESRNHTSLEKICDALATSGSKKSLESMNKLLTHSKVSIVSSALATIIDLGNHTNLPLFISMLEKGRSKDTALQGVLKYGDIDVVPHVIKRVKELVNRKRTRITILAPQQSELMIAMDFLLKYRDQCKEIGKLYEILSVKKIDNLFDLEIGWVHKHKEYFVAK